MLKGLSCSSLWDLKVMGSDLIDKELFTGCGLGKQALGGRKITFAIKTQV